MKVGVPKHRIFIIKPSGNIQTNNTLFHTTYDELNIDVDSLFMDTTNRFSKEKEEYNSFNYWKLSDNLYYLDHELTDIDDDASDIKKEKEIVRNGQEEDNKSKQIVNDIHNTSKNK